MSLTDDYKYCEAIIKRHSASFYKAFKILPLEKRQAIYAVYAFCRIADDCVDIEADARALEALRDQLADFEKGNTPDTPVFRALRDVFHRYAMQTKPFYELIEGQHMDLQFRQPSDMAAFEHYCYLVAGTVGLMILPVLATENAKLLTESAIGLGIAMQITNILRDVGEDRLLNRIYLPSDLLAKEGVNLRILKAPSPEFITVWETLAKKSEQRYDHFLKDVSLYDKDSQVAIKRSALYYRAILHAVRLQAHDCLNKRAHVGTLQKICLSFRALR